jgi:hypothetical protein
MPTATTVRGRTGHRSGICTDPFHKCPEAGKTVELIAAGMCRKCYDQTRTAKTQVQKRLHKSLDLVTEGLDLAGATEEHFNTFYRDYGPLYGDIQDDISKDHARYGKLLAAIKAVGVQRSTPSTVQHSQQTDTAPTQPTEVVRDDNSETPTEAAPAPEPSRPAQQSTEPEEYQPEVDRRRVPPINKRRKGAAA